MKKIKFETEYSLSKCDREGKQEYEEQYTEMIIDKDAKKNKYGILLENDYGIVDGFFTNDPEKKIIKRILADTPDIEAIHIINIQKKKVKLYCL